MANKGNEKVIAGIDAFAKEVATQIFNVHIIFDCEKDTCIASNTSKVIVFCMILFRLILNSDANIELKMNSAKFI